MEINILVYFWSFSSFVCPLEKKLPQRSQKYEELGHPCKGAELGTEVLHLEDFADTAWGRAQRLPLWEQNRMRSACIQHPWG